MLTKSVILGILGGLILPLASCSRQQSRESFAAKLAEADRVIVLNSHNGLTRTLKGDEFQKILHALKTSKPIDSEGLSASPGYTLLFFAGGLHLATVPTSGVVFWIDGKACQDTSGVVPSLYRLGLE